MVAVILLVRKVILSKLTEESKKDESTVCKRRGVRRTVSLGNGWVGKKSLVGMKGLVAVGGLSGREGLGGILVKFVKNNLFY